MTDIQRLCVEAERVWRENAGKAFELYAEAYGLGDRWMAPYRLGCAYYHGHGAPKDLDKAFGYLNQASLDSMRGALHLRGLILKDPKFSGHDDRRALAALQEASRLGVDAASAAIAELEDRHRCPICAAVGGLHEEARAVCLGCGSLPHHRAFMAAYRTSIHYHYPLEGRTGRMDGIMHATLGTQNGDDLDFIFAAPGPDVQCLYDGLKPGGVLFTWQGSEDLARLFQVQTFPARDPHSGAECPILACTKASNRRDAEREAVIARAIEENRRNEREAGCAFSKAYEAFKKTNPGASYAQYAVPLEAQTILEDAPHTTLGRVISERSRQQGHNTYEFYREVLGVKSSSRVLEYGCGSLRVGRHFIAFLEADGYFALDVVNTYFDLGAQMIGDTIAEKRAQFGVTDPEDIARARDFRADHVFCSAVMFHVHPDDIEGTARNLIALTSQPGAKLIFDAKISTGAPARYTQSEGRGGWAWPLAFYQALLPPLELVAVHRRATYQKASGLDVAHLEFRMPSACGR